MGNGEEIAEERLLRMIEGQPSTNTASAAKQTAWDKMRGGSGSFWQRFRWTPQKKREDSLLSKLRLATRLMWVVLVVLGVYVAFDITQSEQETASGLLEEENTSPMDERTVTIAPINLEQLEAPLADLIAAVVERNPFTGSAEQKQQPKIDLPKQSVRQKLSEMAADLRIVGIDRGAIPQAMIEDTNQRRTFFLQAGEMINGLEVIEISDRGVVLGYENQEMLLN